MSFQQRDIAANRFDWHYMRYKDGSEELYDMRADPGETTNLVDSGARREA